MAKRVDANQGEIVRALRAVGCSVRSLHAVGSGTPDLLVGRAGRTYLIEVKTADGTSTPDQIEWASTWNGHLAIVRTPEEAIRAVSQ